MEIRTNQLSTSERQGRAGGGEGRNNPRRTCTYCKKREPSNARPEQKLKRCSRCRTSAYCSRACQRADWKKGHRRTCISGAIMARNSCYLDGLQSEEMVMDQLVDAYRLRVEDERMYCGRLRGRYSVNTTRTSASPPAVVVDAERSEGSNNNTGQALQYALQDFQDFLDLAESESRNNNHSNEGHRDYDNAEEEEEDTNGDSSSPSSSTTSDNSSSSSPPSSLTLTATTIATTANDTTKQGKDATILPQWWDAEKRALCEARAVDGSGDIWSNLGNPAGKDDIIHHYQDNLMPMKLRMLAERVYGSDVMGQFRL